MDVLERLDGAICTRLMAALGATPNVTILGPGGAAAWRHGMAWYSSDPCCGLAAETPNAEGLLRKRMIPTFSVLNAILSPCFVFRSRLPATDDGVVNTGMWYKSDGLCVH